MQLVFYILYGWYHYFYVNLQSMDAQISNNQWSENIILVDGDYIDQVAFDLIVNFERMIGRRIPAADTARWIDCIALDGGIREGTHDTQVIFVHSKEKTTLENFQPGNF